MKSIDSAESRSPIVPYIWLLRYYLFMKISLWPFMTPSSYRLTLVTWLRLDFHPKSRAVLSTYRNCWSTLTNWQHMIGKPVKLEIIAQCNLELKWEFWFFGIAGIKPVTEPSGVIQAFFTWATLLNGHFRFRAPSCSTHSPGLILVFISNNYGAWGITRLHVKLRRAGIHSVAFPSGYHRVEDH